MEQSQATLSPAARPRALNAGISELDVQRARMRSVSEYDRPAYLVVIGELDDGTRVHMSCRHDRPWHIVTLTFSPARSRPSRASP